jgi:hypothetical protein
VFPQSTCQNLASVRLLLGHEKCIQRESACILASVGSVVGHETCFHRESACILTSVGPIAGTKRISTDNLPGSWPQLVLLLDMKSVST